MYSMKSRRKHVLGQFPGVSFIFLQELIKMVACSQTPPRLLAKYGMYVLRIRTRDEVISERLPWVLSAYYHHHSYVHQFSRS